jgi:hypothetical protein
MGISWLHSRQTPRAHGRLRASRATASASK